MSIASLIMPNKRRRKPIALAPPPLHQSSRKKARRVTTLFHKYTRQRVEALARDDSEQVSQLDQLIEEMGGRAAYQKASQVSTSFFSTSKWVLGVLARNGWLYGIRMDHDETQSGASPTNKTRKRRALRRKTRVLEVGAINTELLDSAEQTIEKEGCSPVPKYKLQVRAIDIHSMYRGRIEQADFLKIPLISPEDPDNRYDVIVCSMVLNCVTTPFDRGEMLSRLFHFLRPGGLCFLTIPKSCLTLSPYINREMFCGILHDIGLQVEDTKDSPKVTFFLCRKKPAIAKSSTEVEKKWSEKRVFRQGKKYKNDFAVILTAANVLGRSFNLRKET